MSAKEPLSFTDHLRKNGDKRPDHERFINVNAPPTAEQIAYLKSLRPPAPPAPPRPYSKVSPSFLTLKDIIMDDQDLTAEQKLRLIDKISDLYQ